MTHIREEEEKVPNHTGPNGIINRSKQIVHNLKSRFQSIAIWIWFQLIYHSNSNSTNDTDNMNRTISNMTRVTTRSPKIAKTCTAERCTHTRYLEVCDSTADPVFVLDFCVLKLIEYTVLGCRGDCLNVPSNFHVACKKTLDYWHQPQWRPTWLRSLLSSTSCSTHTHTTGDLRDEPLQPINCTDNQSQNTKCNKCRKCVS